MPRRFSIRSQRRSFVARMADEARNAVAGPATLVAMAIVGSFYFGKYIKNLLRL